jgi:hypothetical protein
MSDAIQVTGGTTINGVSLMRVRAMVVARKAEHDGATGVELAIVKRIIRKIEKMRNGGYNAEITARCAARWIQEEAIAATPPRDDSSDDAGAED